MRNSSLERPKVLRESSNDEDHTRRVNLIPLCNGSTKTSFGGLFDLGIAG